MGNTASVVFARSGDVGALFLGSKRVLRDEAFMARVGAAVSLGLVVVDPAKHPNVQRRLRVYVGDDPESAPLLRERFAEVVRFIHDARRDGLDVLVHCSMGVSRSAAVVLAYLRSMFPDRHLTACLRWLREVRPQASPNVGLMRELREWSVEGLEPFPSDVERFFFKRETRGADAAAAAAAAHARDLWIPRRVDEVQFDEVLSPLVFARDFVGPSKPLVLHTAAAAAASSSRFSARALAARYGNREVTVHATPDGRADSIVWKGGVAFFAKPEVRRSTLAALFEHLEEAAGEEVLYASAQDDSLRRDLPELEAELRDDLFHGRRTPLPEACLDAFGPDVKIEALNLWIGGSRSVTSAHRDRAFENLYLVLDGEKTFYLLPPTAPAWLRTRRCPPATWRRSEKDHWALDHDDGEAASLVDWLDCALTADDHEVDPLRIVLRPGQLLYLPAGWVHEVHQADDTVAVNWWLDARFDNARWAASDIAQHLATRG